MLYVLFFSLAGDEDVVDIGTAEVETTQNTIDEALEGLEAFRKPNGILRNSNEPNGVVIAAFVMSSGATGSWWYARTRSIVEKTVLPCSDETQSCHTKNGK